MIERLTSLGQSLEESFASNDTIVNRYVNRFEKHHLREHWKENNKKDDKELIRRTRPLIAKTNFLESNCFVMSST